MNKKLELYKRLASMSFYELSFFLGIFSIGIFITFFFSLTGEQTTVFFGIVLITLMLLIGYSLVKIKYQGLYLDFLKERFNQEYRLEVTNEPTINIQKLVFLFRRNDLINRIIYPKFIRGQIEGVPYTQHYIETRKNYWIAFLILMIFFPKNHPVEFVSYLLFVLFYLFRYFKGDYYFFEFSRPFPFTALYENHFFRERGYFLPQDFTVGNIRIFTDNDSAHSFITAEMMEIIERLNAKGKYVSFGFKGTEFQLSVRNSKSILKTDFRTSFEERFEVYKEQTAEVETLVRLINKQINK